MRTAVGNHHADILIGCCKVAKIARDLEAALRREGLRKDAKASTQSLVRVLLSGLPRGIYSSPQSKVS